MSHRFGSISLLRNATTDLQDSEEDLHCVSEGKRRESHLNS